LSGAPLKPLTLSALRTLRAHLPPSIPLIGCGGITTGDDALEYAKAGASLVQVYTGFGYDGAGACRRIKDQLVEALAKEGKTWTEVVERAVTNLSLKQAPPAQKEKGKAEPASVGTLIKEAEDLKRLLDSLGEKLETEKLEVADNGAVAMVPVI
jgi:dihydroorotate dehydrogenase